MLTVNYHQVLMWEKTSTLTMYYVKSNLTNALISLNQIEKAINAHDCKTLQDLSNYFNLPTTHLFQTMWFYNLKYTNLLFQYIKN